MHRALHTAMAHNAQSTTHINGTQCTEHYTQQWHTMHRALHTAMAHNAQSTTHSNGTQCTEHYTQQWHTMHRALHTAMCTCTHKVLNVPFLPFQEVPSLPTAQVQNSGSLRQVCSNENAFYPVIEIAHLVDWAL